MIGSVVVLAGTTNGTGHGFGNLAHLAVVGIVFSGPTCFADGNERFIVVLAGGAMFTHGVGSTVGFVAVPAAPTIVAGNGIRGLPNLNVVGVNVLASAANFTVGLSCFVVVFG